MTIVRKEKNLKKSIALNEEVFERKKYEQLGQMLLRDHLRRPTVTIGYETMNVIIDQDMTMNY